MKTFTFKFDGNRADEIAERFASYYWDGGLDQYLENNFFEQFGLDCDNMEFVSKYEVKINTDKE